ncbi:endo alpha-1,4 polygalactosaminidase [Spirochaeta isovalerica]|uniref:Cysteinyl-tRNA synthetase n=1 Tax=Spirochaeta isovalerica TaxID=150 RepID=A0A841RBA8_9SPIO|nr:endo alpha-1,4 polygalactosaminidase [Spirochaeta isovalerica]MBB6480199.1 cysteinyl-tRNA synthetase [Spirochaeta isovalerica]
MRQRRSSVPLRLPLLLFFAGILFTEGIAAQQIDYRGEMRSLVEEISRYGKERHPGFAVIPQNGQELLTSDGTAAGQFVSSYLDAIDGVGREDLYYGYRADNRKTPEYDTEYMLGYLTAARDRGLSVLAVDYCRSRSKMDDSIEKNRTNGFLVFAADRRELDRIPTYPSRPVDVNNREINELKDAANFLYIINPSDYSSREAFISDLERSEYDMFIIDLFDDDGIPLTAVEIERLKRKPQGGRRLVISYMSIGEAEDYRYYWDSSWERNPPSWLERENPHWKGNYKVRYWYPLWKAMIFGNENAYLDLILDRGFDGVYLDIIDAFWYFEN